MRWLLVPILAALTGCRACYVDVPYSVETNVAAAAPAHSAPDVLPCAAAIPEDAPPGSLDLPALWNLALANNPALREASAEVEAARGRLIQAGKYVNPQIAYTQENLGTPKNAAGAVRLEVIQEIVTAGKRPLDVAIAARGRDVAAVGLLGRKFEVLTRVRRAYYDYVGWLYAVRANEEVVATLEEGLQITRKLVEAGTRPGTDVLQVRGRLSEARVNLAQSRVNLEATWRQLAAEVSVPQLPRPEAADFPANTPQWDANVAVQRVLAANTELKQAAVRAEQARLEAERARAEAVPNVTVGGGFAHNFADPEAETGAVLSVQTPLPLWDRKQGRIHEAQARWAQARAAERSTATRLSRDTAAAFARYEAARQQVEGLTAEVLPQLRESLERLRKSYRGGGAQVTFADILLAEQALNTARLTLAEARRTLWLAVADLQGLMQLDLDEELGVPGHPCR